MAIAIDAVLPSCRREHRRMSVAGEPASTENRHRSEGCPRNLAIALARRRSTPPGGIPSALPRCLDVRREGLPLPQSPLGDDPMIPGLRTSANLPLRFTALTLTIASLFSFSASASGPAALPWSALDPIDIPAFRAIERPAPTREIRYGSDAVQTVDLFLPQGSGPFPVVALIHGGCWSAKTAGREQLRHLGADLARRGMAVWSMGYRRADEAGGGYPGTFQDIATALDLLRDEAPHYRLDLSRTVLVGHSAGGHLALWAAGRDRLPQASRLRTADPFVPHRVVSLAGVGDLQAFAPLVPGICGQGIIDRLVAAPTEGRGNVFADTSPSSLGATDAQVVMISGVLDRLVPPYVAHDYARSVRSDITVKLVNVEGAGHFDLVAPGRPGWDIALSSIEATLAR